LKWDQKESIRRYLARVFWWLLTYDEVLEEREYAFHTSLISQWVSCWLRWSHFRF
jgi:hypothetical protein